MRTYFLAYKDTKHTHQQKIVRLNTRRNVLLAGISYTYFPSFSRSFKEFFIWFLYLYPVASPLVWISGVYGTDQVY